MAELTNRKYEAFLNEYVKHFNISRAYLKIYPNTKNSDVASAAGNKVLKMPKVDARLKEILKARRERVGLDSAYVVEYLKGVAELDLEEFASIGKKGMTLKEFKSVPREIRRYVTEVNVTETKSGKVVVNFKVFSKEKAVDMLAKHTGAVKERVELSGEVSVKSITDLVNSNS